MLTGMYSGKASSQGTLHIVYHVAKYQCVNEMMEFVYIVYVAIHNDMTLLHKHQWSNVIKLMTIH